QQRVFISRRALRWEVFFVAPFSYPFTDSNSLDWGQSRARPARIRRGEFYREALSPSQWFGIAGSLALLLGLCLPFMSSRQLGDMMIADLGANGASVLESTVLTVLAVLSLLLALRGLCPVLVFTAIAVQFVVASSYVVELRYVSQLWQQVKIVPYG